MEIITLSDPAQFARAIRGLARDAHEVLTRSPSSAALRRLSRRIDHVAAVPGTPLGTWLENLRREVRSAAVHRAGSERPACLCA